MASKNGYKFFGMSTTNMSHPVGYGLGCECFGQYFTEEVTPYDFQGQIIKVHVVPSLSTTHSWDTEQPG